MKLLALDRLAGQAGYDQEFVHSAYSIQAKSFNYGLDAAIPTERKVQTAA